MIDIITDLANVVLYSLRFRIEQQYPREYQIIKELTEFLPNDTTPIRRCYHIFHNVQTIPLCPICHINHLKWDQNKRVYQSTCSTKCNYVLNNTQRFLTKATKKHSSKYSYDNVIYIDCHTLISITCPIHGDFLQKPKDHLNGNGCQICGGSIRYNTSSFIERSKLIHKDKYNYSKVDYINQSTKVTIICPIHGDFQQTPTTHIQGSGCNKCCKSKKSNIIEFIGRSSDKHNNKYDYSQAVYINSDTLLDIICPTHGIFQQTPNNHINGGYGCPQCGHTRKSGRYNQRYFEKFPERMNWNSILYVMRFSNDNEAFVKIGITIRPNIRDRFRTHVYDGYKLEILGMLQSDLYNCWIYEQTILTHFNDCKYTHHLQDTWFGKHECFDISQQHNIIAYLKNLSDLLIDHSINPILLMDRIFTPILK